MPRLTFGRPPVGIACEDRLAAYAVILDARDQVAVVRARDRWFLPGGGSLPGETPEATVLREIQEECGCAAHVVEPLGEAFQYFHDSTRWYAMVASFFRAEFVAEPTGSGDHPFAWLDSRELDGFFHECHAWAVARARRR